MRLRLWGFLFHRNDAILRVDLHDAASLQFFDVGLVVTHRATRSLFTGVFEKPLQTKIKEIVPREDEKVVVDLEGFDPQSEIAHGAESRFIRRRSVVDDGDIIGTRLRPFVKMIDKASVGDDAVPVD